MKDIMGMMKKAQELQQRMGEIQAEAETAEVEGVAGGGLVKVTLTAKGDLRAIKIDPSLFAEDEVEILEDLLVTAHADAKRKGEEYLQSKMADVTAGLPMPPGMKFPF